MTKDALIEKGPTNSGKVIIRVMSEWKRFFSIDVLPKNCRIIDLSNIVQMCERESVLLSTNGQLIAVVWRKSILASRAAAYVWIVLLLQGEATTYFVEMGALNNNIE